MNDNTTIEETGTEELNSKGSPVLATDSESHPMAQAAMLAQRSTWTWGEGEGEQAHEASVQSIAAEMVPVVYQYETSKDDAGKVAGHLTGFYRRVQSIAVEHELTLEAVGTAGLALLKQEFEAAWKKAHNSDTPKGMGTMSVYLSYMRKGFKYQYHLGQEYDTFALNWDTKPTKGKKGVLAPEPIQVEKQPFETISHIAKVWAGDARNPKGTKTHEAMVSKVAELTRVPDTVLDKGDAPSPDKAPEGQDLAPDVEEFMNTGGALRASLVNMMRHAAALSENGQTDTLAKYIESVNKAGKRYKVETVTETTTPKAHAA